MDVSLLEVLIVVAIAALAVALAVWIVRAL